MKFMGKIKCRIWQLLGDTHAHCHNCGRLALTISYSDPHQSQKSKQSRQVIYRARFCDILTITVCSAFTRSHILIPLHIPLDLPDKHLIQTITNPTPKSPYAFIHSFVSHLTCFSDGFLPQVIIILFYYLFSIIHIFNKMKNVSSCGN